MSHIIWLIQYAGTMPDKNEQNYHQENCNQDPYNNENYHFFLFENKIYFCHFIFCLLSIEINFENWSKYKSLIWHPSPLLVPKYSITFIKTLIGCDEIATCYIYLNFDIWSVLAGSEISGCPDCSRLIGGYCPVQYPRNRFLSSLAKTANHQCNLVWRMSMNFNVLHSCFSLHLF